MRPLILLAGALLAFLIAANAPAAAQQSSPFQRGPAPQAEAAKPSWYGEAMAEVRRIQGELYRQLAGAVRVLKQDYSLSTAWGLIAISLLYGVFHAVGPGHGKAVITSYLLANERAVRQGVLLALLSSVAQGVSAIALVFGGAWAFDLVGQRLLGAAWSLEQASFGLIAAIGAWLLWQAATGRGHPHHRHSHDEQDHGHDHHHHGPDMAVLTREPLTIRRALPIVLAVGIRPCGGALIVLVFAIANGLYWAGVGATFAMSMGTAVTVSALAVLTLASKRLALGLAARDMVWIGRIEVGLKVLGALALLAFGLIFLAASLDGPRAPFGV
ncbi:nickel/cobalt transporter [Minwuia thermotolerans]|uniref:Nickel/cobalt efflux system n=1 Tax=Minwuia thermotolerans TaxID=2056226 RepID=A0A2M9G1U0_9PROT|nr:nickel/cobalt transporter [Minwuia thermotolerans]PJK29681.1 hypothetical protein CVT23_11600 [Minwuia thermotolerans]